jgi:dTMP kinase
MIMGCLITFEGVEGSGKTTQIRVLADRLIAAGYTVILTREPGGCMIADKIRSVLLDADNQGMQPLTELMLYAAARSQHVAEIIVPALAAGSVVLCDRFSDATVAYQHFGRGIDRTTIDQLNLLACQQVHPDLTILIDCDVEIGLRRAKMRIEDSQGPREERFELEAISFHQRVRDGYLQLAAEAPQRILTVSADGVVEEIAERISTQVFDFLKAGSRALC